MADDLWLNANGLQEYIFGKVSKIKDKLKELEPFMGDAIRKGHNQAGNIDWYLKKTEIEKFCRLAKTLRMRDILKSQRPEIPLKEPNDLSPVELTKYIKEDPKTISRALSATKPLLPDLIQERLSGSTRALFLVVKDTADIQKFCEVAKLKMRSTPKTSLSKEEISQGEDYLSAYALKKYVFGHEDTIRKQLWQQKKKMPDAIVEKMASNGKTTVPYLLKTKIAEFCENSGLKMRPKGNEGVLDFLESLQNAPMYLSATELEKYLNTNAKIIKKRLGNLQNNPELKGAITQKTARNGVLTFYLDKKFLIPFCKVTGFELLYPYYTADEPDPTHIPFRRKDELGATELHEYIVETPSKIAQLLRDNYEVMPGAIVQRRGPTGFVTFYLKKDRVVDFCKLTQLKMRSVKKEKKEPVIEISQNFTPKEETSQWLSPYALGKLFGLDAGTAENLIKRNQYNKQLVGKVKMLYSQHANHELLHLHNDEKAIDIIRRIVESAENIKTNWLTYKQLKPFCKGQTKSVVLDNLTKLQHNPVMFGRIISRKTSDGDIILYLRNDKESIRLFQELTKNEWLSVPSLRQYCKFSDIAIKYRLAALDKDPDMRGKILVKSGRTGEKNYYLHNDPETIKLFQKKVSDIWLTPSILRNYCDVKSHEAIEKYLARMQNDERMKGRIKPIYSNKAKREVLHLHDDKKSIELFRQILKELKMADLKRGQIAVKALDNMKQIKKPKSDEYSM